MRLLAICGSLQQRSSNLTLLHRAAAFAPADVEFVLYDGLGTIPPFDPDVEARGFPAAQWIFTLCLHRGLCYLLPVKKHSFVLRCDVGRHGGVAAQ